VGYAVRVISNLLKNIYMLWPSAQLGEGFWKYDTGCLAWLCEVTPASRQSVGVKLGLQVRVYVWCPGGTLQSRILG